MTAFSFTSNLLSPLRQDTALRGQSPDKSGLVSEPFLIPSFHLYPSQMVLAQKLTPEQYITSSIIRFGRLDTYIQEKLAVDFFAIKGNLMIAEGLKAYIQKNLHRLKNVKKIRLLDIGPAIGAISTLCALQTFEEFNLLEKVQVHLLDVSEKVIELTQRCKFGYPGSILNPKLKGKIFKKIRESKGIICSAEEIPAKDNYFDIILTGFLFHHLHDSIKPLVAKEVMRILTPEGFLGVSEEWFKNYKKEYAKFHANDQISLAYEAIVSFRKLSKMFPNLDIFFTYDKNNRTNSYTFCGTKITLQTTPQISS